MTRGEALEVARVARASRRARSHDRKIARCPVCGSWVSNEARVRHACALAFHHTLGGTRP